METIDDNRGDLNQFYNKNLSEEDKKKLDLEFEKLINNIDNFDFLVENYPEEFASLIKGVI